MALRENPSPNLKQGESVPPSSGCGDEAFCGLPVAALRGQQQPNCCYQETGLFISVVSNYKWCYQSESLGLGSLGSYTLSKLQEQETRQ